MLAGHTRRCWWMGAALVAALCLGAGLHVALPALASAPAGDQGDPPPATPELGGFAFPDRAGTSLLLLGDSIRPSSDAPPLSELRGPFESLRTAFCSDGRSHSVAFARAQKDDGKGNGRQSPHTFDHLEGLVFGLKGEPIPSERSACFMAADSFATSLSVTTTDSLRPLIMPPEMRGCDAGLAARIGSQRKRRVASCWRLAAPHVRGGPAVVAVLFARHGNDALASVVVVDDSHLIFADQPGDYNREGGTSVWRVDDQGKFDPAWLDVLLLARRGPKTILAFSWIGAEGTVLRLLESDGNRFRELLRDAWYQAPL